jgi:hypothetical protein
MQRRRPVVVERRGPGLMGTIARTAVISGTATATSKTMSNAMNKPQSQTPQAQSSSDTEQFQNQLAAVQAQQVQNAVNAHPADKPDITAQLQQLAQIKQENLLTEDEFLQAKAKILSS